MCPRAGKADDSPEMDDEDSERATTERGDDRAVTGDPRFGRGPHGCAVALEVHFVRHER